MTVCVSFRIVNGEIKSDLKTREDGAKLNDSQLTPSWIAALQKDWMRCDSIVRKSLTDEFNKMKESRNQSERENFKDNPVINVDVDECIRVLM